MSDRPQSGPVIWYGTAVPKDALPGDLWFDTKTPDIPTVAVGIGNPEPEPEVETSRFEELDW